MRDFHKEYMEYCNTPSDINEHLPVLHELGLDCNSIVEFGVGYGRSTRAFIATLLETNGSLKSYDLVELDGVASLFNDAKEQGLNVEFHQENTIEIYRVDTDLLLVDSHHTYEQVRDELAKHASGVKKYIVFHDTVTFGEHGQDSGSRGIMPAIMEFLGSHAFEWEIYLMYENNNGLMVLSRK